jgi:signal transduction histidine kinase
MVLIQDLTDFSQRTYQLLLLHEISLAIEGVIERDKLLHLILTSVTAGFALGFSRAFLFLVDDRKEQLLGIMGVGPSSYKEAYETWNELSKQMYTLQDYLNRINDGDLEKSTVQHLVDGMTFDLRKADNVITETVKTADYIHILDAWDNSRVNGEMRKLLASNEFVTIPLIARNEVIGVLMADNAYSGRSISQESIEVLTMFGVSAAIAIEKAKMLSVLEEQVSELQKAYVELEKAQKMIIKNERLAAIGEVSARLAHEIRNPLSTIGGFAKSIPKKYDDKDRTIRNANIITEEVAILEQILSNVLDFSKQSLPQKTLTDINELIIKTLSMFEGGPDFNGITVLKDFEKEKIEARFDPSQIKQVLINIIRNALNAMPENGTLTIKTVTNGENVSVNISDTGCGIPREDFENIFEPFFTTHGRGTGLGLSISQKIIRNHDGDISINSEVGKGTTVNIFLPIK